MDRQPAADFPLLTMACQGDKRAMEILIEFCGTRMRRVIRKLCRKSPGLDVDDIFQDTWLLLLNPTGRGWSSSRGRCVLPRSRRQDRG